MVYFSRATKPVFVPLRELPICSGYPRGAGSHLPGSPLRSLTGRRTACYPRGGSLESMASSTWDSFARSDKPPAEGRILAYISSRRPSDPSMLWRSQGQEHGASILVRADCFPALYQPKIPRRVVETLSWLVFDLKWSGDELRFSWASSYARIHSALARGRVMT